MAATDASSWRRWRRALADTPLPCAVVDLDAFDHNAKTILGKLEGASVTLRPASKSVRIPALLRRVAELGGARVRGLMTFSARETAWLATEHGFDDLLLAYPIARPDDAATLASCVAGGARLTVAIDDVAQIQLLAAAATAVGVELPVCIDVDASWRPARGKLHFGVRRSPVRAPEQAVALADAVRTTEGVRLNALLAYEAQVAGIRGRNPGSRHLDPMRRLIKRRSRPVVARRRADVVRALRAAGHVLEIVNGGGTGSLDSTSRDPSCTEVTAGSGFLCPHLFDGYAGLDLQPAAFFAIPVVRRSDPGFVTCFGGGYVASGAAGADRLPIVHLPKGLTPLGMEGFGEVQTPFAVGRDAPRLGLGDPILCRHAKGGELTERFNEVTLVRGDQVVDRVPTYRGLGLSVG